jgi:hypothetical protein
MGKKQGNKKKRVVYGRGRFSWGLGTPSAGLCPRGAPPTEECTRMGTSTKNLLNLKFYIIICQLPLCSLVLPAWLRGCPPPLPTRWPSPRFPDPHPHFLLTSGVSWVHLAVTRFSSSRPRVYYTILDILCECFFGEDKRRERKGPPKKKKKKVESITPRHPPLCTKDFYFFCIICKKQKERERWGHWVPSQN